MLNETIEGGAFKNAAGEWRNANGEPLKDADAKRAEKLAAEQQAELDAAEVTLMDNAAQRDPVARALSTLLRQTIAPQPEAKE